MSSVEFSRIMALADVPPKGTEIRFKASEEECAALATRFDLVALSDFSGRAHMRPWRRVGLVVEGSFSANVSQTCVLTLDRVDSRVREEFKLHFLPLAMIEKLESEAAEREIIVDAASEDAPEPLEGDAIDLGELMAEQLGLGIDPYPRRPGAILEIPETASEAALKPFAALQALKKGD
jgi:hypothetical protein